MLKTSNFRTINRHYDIVNTVLIARLDKFFKRSNPYRHFSDYHNSPTGTWQSWTFYDRGGEVLLRIGDQEYVEGLDLWEIDQLVRQIVESKNDEPSHIDICERLVLREMCEATNGCSWHANSAWPKCKD